MVRDKLDYELDALLTDDSIGIDISRFICLRNSPLELSMYLDMPIDEIEKKDNWYKCGNDIYYVKRRLTIRNVLNELIGEYLSKYMNLPSVHQDLAMDRGRIVGLVSKNFRDENTVYVKANKLSDAEHERILKVLKARPNIFNCRQKKIMYNYIARNFYANQSDRMDNVLCSPQFNMMMISTLYDYEFSLTSPENKYLVDPYFMGITIGPKLINRLVMQDKNMLRSIEKVLLFDMREVLMQIEDEHRITIPDEHWERYIDYDSKRKMLIENKILGGKK